VGLAGGDSLFDSGRLGIEDTLFGLVGFPDIAGTSDGVDEGASTFLVEKFLFNSPEMSLNFLPNLPLVVADDIPDPALLGEHRLLLLHAAVAAFVGQHIEDADNHLH
jgi:hypothetical protein